MCIYINRNNLFKCDNSLLLVTSKKNKFVYHYKIFCSPIAVPVQCSAVQCTAVHCTTLHYSTVQCSAVQCSAVQYNASGQVLSVASGKSGNKTFFKEA